MTSLLFFQTLDQGWHACGRLGRPTSARTKTSARLKITFVDMTYPKGWTGSLPLCPLIFSCRHITGVRRGIKRVPICKGVVAVEGVDVAILLTKREHGIFPSF